jgi:hypothetical protein
VFAIAARSNWWDFNVPHPLLARSGAACGTRAKRATREWRLATLWAESRALAAKTGGEYAHVSLKIQDFQK